MVRNLLAENTSSITNLTLVCNAPSKYIQADSLQWVTSHPGQHVVSHSIHFIGIPKEFDYGRYNLMLYVYICYDEWIEKSRNITEKSV